MQQLMYETSKLFISFIKILTDRKTTSIEFDAVTVFWNFLTGFFLGTRTKFFKGGQESLTITVKEVACFSVEMSIVLVERTVGLNAILISINFNQPGVEIRKTATAKLFALEAIIQKHLSVAKPSLFTAKKISEAIGLPQRTETTFKICEHLATNFKRGISKHLGLAPFEAAHSKI